MANTNLLWRGAVEPAESSPSGNENRAWRGAVEPLGAESEEENGMASSYLNITVPQAAEGELLAANVYRGYLRISNTDATNFINVNAGGGAATIDDIRIPPLGFVEWKGLGVPVAAIRGLANTADVEAVIQSA